MIRHIHHPSCPAGHEAGAPCICPDRGRRRRRRTIAAEFLAFSALLACVVSLPLYVLWRAVA